MKQKLEEQQRLKQQQQMQQLHLQQQQQLQLQQQHQEEERRRKQLAARTRDMAPPLPARGQAPATEDIFKDDPWFQNPAEFSNGPIYQNTVPAKLDLSLDSTTEEIDIDAVLGYPDIAEEPELERQHELDQQPVIRQIEEIIWPKSDPEPPEDEDGEGDASFSSQGKGSGKKKSGFFSFAGKKKSRRSDSPGEYVPPEPALAPEPEIEPVPVLAAEYYVEDKTAKQEKKKFWGKKSSKGQLQQQQPFVANDDAEAFGQQPDIDEVDPKRKPEKEKKSFFGAKKSKSKPVPQNFEPEEEEPVQVDDNNYDDDDEDAATVVINEDVDVEEVKKTKKGVEKKSIWSIKKPKQKPPPPPREEPHQAQPEPEPEPEVEDFVEDRRGKPKSSKMGFWGVKKPKSKPPVQQSETEEEFEQELPPPPVEDDSQEDEVQYSPREPVPAFEPGTESESAPEPEGHVVDVVAEALAEPHHQEVDQVEDYVEEPVEHKRPAKKSGLGAFFHKPNLKGLKKPAQPAKKPTQIGQIPPVDVSHLLDEEFGIEEPPPPPPMTSDDDEAQPQHQQQQHQHQQYHETETSDNNTTEQQETSDESPEEARTAPGTKKSKFSLKINLKKDKPEKEEKAESSRPKPAKFFKAPSFKSPKTSSNRRTPKTSPASRPDVEDEKSPERDSSNERPQQQRSQHNSPPKVEVIEHQIESLNLNDTENDDDSSYVEPAPIQTSEDDERRESVTADEAKFTSDETGADDEQVVNLPVEMEEPEPTQPIRGRPKTARKKSVGSGFAGLFSSSRPSSRTRSGKREQDVQREPELEAEAAALEPEEDRSFDNRRRSDSKGLGGLFASKRNKQRRPRPLSGPPAGAVRDDEEPKEEFQPEPETQEEPTRLLRRQRSTGLTGFLFSSRRGNAAKSTGNLAERKREPEEGHQREEEPEDRQSYNNSTSSLNRPKRERGFGAMFGAPKTRQSGRKPMPRSTTFPLQQQQQQPPMQQQQQQEQQQQPESEDELHEPAVHRHQPQLEQSPRQPRVQQSPRPSERSVEDQRPQLPLPSETVNQYSPTPKLQDQMVYDQIEIANDEVSPPRREPEPPRDPNRQLGRRSGRFRRPQDGPGNTSINSLNNSRQISSTSMMSATTPPSKPETTQGMMRDLFAEKVVRRPAAGATQNAGRISTEDSNAASSLGADFEYEKAMRAGPGHDSRSRQGKRATGPGAVSRTDSYRQAHTSGPGPAAQDRDRKMQNYNSLPRLGGKRRPPQDRQQPQPRQQQQQPDQDENYDSRSLGDRPRSRNGRVEDPCSVM